MNLRSLEEEGSMNPSPARIVFSRSAAQLGIEGYWGGIEDVGAFGFVEAIPEGEGIVEIGMGIEAHLDFPPIGKAIAIGIQRRIETEDMLDLSDIDGGEVVCNRGGKPRVCVIGQSDFEEPVVKRHRDGFELSFVDGTEIAFVVEGEDKRVEVRAGAAGENGLHLVAGLRGKMFDLALIGQRVIVGARSGSPSPVPV